MAVAEAFLRGGSPFTSLKKLKEEFCADFQSVGSDDYSPWECVFVIARQWAVDLRENSYFVPSCLMFFGSPVKSVAGESHHLFRYDAIDILSVKRLTAADLAIRVHRSIRDTLAACPEGVRPLPSKPIRLVVQCSATHQALGLFDVAAFGDAIAALEADQALPAITMASTSGAVASDTVEQSLQWVLSQSLSTKREEIERLPNLRGFLELIYLFDSERGIAETTKKPKQPIEAAMTLASRVWDVPFTSVMEPSIRRPLCWLPATIPSDAATTRWRHVVLMQPSQTDRVMSADGIVQGPLQPQARGPVLHIHCDAGDVLFAEKAVMLSQCPVETYDDILPQDGEIRVQLGCVEGVPFDDLDIFVEWLAGGVDRCRSSAFAVISPYSCCRWPFPRVELRCPTGIVARRTPVESPAMVVEAHTVTAEVAGAALEALRWLLSLNVGNDDVKTDVVKRFPPLILTPEPMVCHWCHRQREKLLRCGGCKVATYCSRDHQMNDWKASHKAECGLWRQSKAEYDSVVEPRRHNDDGLGTTTFESSCAATVASLLARMVRQPAPAHGIAFIIHVVQFDGDVPLLLHELGTRFHSLMGFITNKGYSELRIVLCATTLCDADRNVVFEVSDNGRVSTLAPTGVLGDVWHTGATGCDDSHETQRILVRLYNEKYHFFASNQSNNATLSPDAIIVFGSEKGEGMSYFTAATEIIADNYFGVIPVACTESSLIALHRTAQALLRRVSMSPKGCASHQSRELTFELNVECMVRSPQDRRDRIADVEGLPSLSLPCHRNMYLFVVL